MQTQLPYHPPIIFLLDAQVSMTKAANPNARVFVYRNLVKVNTHTHPHTHTHTPTGAFACSQTPPFTSAARFARFMQALPWYTSVVHTNH